MFKHTMRFYKVIIGIVFPHSVFVMAKLLTMIKGFSKTFFDKKKITKYITNKRNQVLYSKKPQLKEVKRSTSNLGRLS